MILSVGVVAQPRLTWLAPAPHNMRDLPRVSPNVEHMTFDEQLRREVDALSGRLRDEIAQQVRTAADAIAAAGRAEREQSEAQARAASDRAAAAIADAEARAYAYGKDEGRSAGLQEHDAASARLVDALRALDGARSLTSIL